MLVSNFAQQWETKVREIPTQAESKEIGKSPRSIVHHMEAACLEQDEPIGSTSSEGPAHTVSIV